MTTFIVTGTDTGIGKTVFSAGLTQALQATYWKPVQAGLEEETDSEFVGRLSGQTVLPEAHRLGMPASPHLSAEAEGAIIDPNALTLPDVTGPLVVEGAGGLMVPVNRQTLYIDIFARWQKPVILCARTQLGTINHTLLSLQALRTAGCDVHGVAFIGDPEPEVEQTIVDFGQTRRLGRLPMLPELNPDTLQAAFARAFPAEAFHV
ncbi:dethiobiotin synthase [Halocynthiibacter styelae]|uniref:ATP-dependent dethiobiotin synthetase BioD n=1 Tax=Halocynthiibacter styelae TaxID=2761955 RepID=A0A8J7ISW7_9RHOB|nr:dethiobiotin synthase [Paenihalocynthiibacter styelae]MBI1494991.1 ATP-dependent dethiobiotin synthetase BioD [Paenihalocynthiibacter styelae]